VNDYALYLVNKTHEHDEDEIVYFRVHWKTSNYTSFV